MDLNAPIVTGKRILRAIVLRSAFKDEKIRLEAAQLARSFRLEESGIVLDRVLVEDQIEEGLALFSE